MTAMILKTTQCNNYFIKIKISTLMRNCSIMKWWYLMTTIILPGTLNHIAKVVAMRMVPLKVEMLAKAWKIMKELSVILGSHKGFLLLEGLSLMKDNMSFHLLFWFQEKFLPHFDLLAQKEKIFRSNIRYLSTLKTRIYFITKANLKL